MSSAWEFLSTIGYDILGMGQSIATLVGDLIELGNGLGGGGGGGAVPPGQYPLG
ncbi:hypothetical protein KO481_36135 [Nocardia sp. NEAU-G5]|uniref:Porin n=1 Tax=Nocardia albiluteola TaxID=2842303 RepID=A0ABS6B9I5_9NOCA|nr:hypothetical protein [Nocardia albiluteola]MBU3066939.1 hypothetical protein [Nocardia albiluteola]